MLEYKVISNREQAFNAWDRSSVIIREEDGFYFIYPLIKRGYKYPNFNLKRECCLNTFITEERAHEWVAENGYVGVVLR